MTDDVHGAHACRVLQRLDPDPPAARLRPAGRPRLCTQLSPPGVGSVPSSRSLECVVAHPRSAWPQAADVVVGESQSSGEPIDAIFGWQVPVGTRAAQGCCRLWPKEELAEEFVLPYAEVEAASDAIAWSHDGEWFDGAELGPIVAVSWPPLYGRL